jgi:hypothetical protein
MRIHRPRARHRVTAMIAVAALLISPDLPLIAQQTTAAKPPAQTTAAKPPTQTTSAAKPPAQPATAAKPAAQPTAAAATAPKEPDGGWPRDTTTPDGGNLRMFQPQVSSWDGQHKIVLYAAMSYLQKGATKAELGTIKVEAETLVSTTERLVNFTNFKITETHFAGLSNDKLQQIVAHLTSLVVPQNGLVLGLDRVLARLDKSQIVAKNVAGVKADPPPIFYSGGPGMLVNIDGDPIWSPIMGNDLKFAVNTNWDLFQLAPKNELYVRYEKSWLTAADIKGPWTLVKKLPDAFKSIPADSNWTEVKAAVPAKSLKEAEVPKVFVSTVPAEMISLEGTMPKYTAVAGTKLFWVSNTEGDVFRMGQTGLVYFLVSGRWFSAPDFTGPWTFATQTLPDDFKKIPVSHPRSRVLASIPGTDQAIEAVLLAQIPQTARVSKSTVKAPEVVYQGEPQFEPIEKTSVQRAVNTDKDIIKVGDLYYMCFEGVWFMARSPQGPWTVTGSVPGQIYEIPISSPSHSVTYVTVEEDNDDAVVFATAAAYTGMMIAFGCVVWGSGYYYPPYVRYGGYYPYYRPYYPTYGYRASYNPWTGAYSRGAVAYGPYGGAGVGARYNPRTGTYARGAAAYGPYGARGVAEGYNPRTGTYAQTRQGSNVYGSWGSTAVRRGDDWATSQRTTNRATGTTTRTTQTSNGGESVRKTGPNGSAGVARTGSGDVYAGRDGNVYRNEGDGWQKYDNGGWNDTPSATPQQREQAQQRADDARANGGASTTDRANTGTTRGSGTSAGTMDSATRSQLDRDAAARREGSQRTKDLGTSQRSGSAGGSSYRPSTGGASRARSGGGGGRRR